LDRSALAYRAVQTAVHRVHRRKMAPSGEARRQGRTGLVQRDEEPSPARSYALAEASAIPPRPGLPVTHPTTRRRLLENFAAEERPPSGEGVGRAPPLTGVTELLSLGPGQRRPPAPTPCSLWASSMGKEPEPGEFAWTEMEDGE